MTLKPYEAVIFDMDGLLINSERVMLQSFVETAEDMALTSDPEIFKRTLGLRADKADPIMNASLGISGDRADHFNAEYRRRYQVKMEVKVPVMPGAIALASHLFAQGIPTAVATSTRTQMAETKLKKAGLRDFMLHVIGGDQVENPKPAPDIYWKAAAKLGVDPTKCAGFEDSPTGTKAAVSAGLTLVQVPDILEPTPELRALGHTIADSLLDGALKIGLITELQWQQLSNLPAAPSA